MDEMKSVHHHMLPSAVGAFAAAEEMLSRAAAKWFAQHGAKLHPENHFLRLNHVKVFSSSDRTRYERTADLVLKGEVAAGTNNKADKVLLGRALIFTVEWPNSQEDAGGISETEKS